MYFTEGKFYLNIGKNIIISFRVLGLSRNNMVLSWEERIIGNSKEVFCSYFTFSGRDCTSLLPRHLPQKIREMPGKALLASPSVEEKRENM